jgi:hypothetical protein
MMRRLLVLILLVGCWSGKLLASDGKNKFETLWIQKGPHTVLKPLSIKYKFSNAEMNAFVYSRIQKFQKNRNDFWFHANSDTSWQMYESLSKSLEMQQLDYTLWVSEFSKEKASNSLQYKTVLKTWEIASAPPPSGTGSGTICENVDFENAAGGHFSNWSAWEGVSCFFEPTLSCNAFNTAISPGSSSYITLKDANSGIPYDSVVGNNRLPQVAPGGNYSILLENQLNGGHASKLEYSFIVDSNKPIYGARFAVVLEEPNGGHDKDEKPYFQISYRDITTNENLNCGWYRVIADNTDPEFGSSKFEPVSPGSSIKFMQWDTSLVDFSGKIGHEIKVTFVVSDCALGGHLGYAYIDGGCFSDPITVGPCLGDGTRELSVSGLFPKYRWKGDGITGTNSALKILVDNPGNYVLCRHNGESSCKSYEYVTVDSCSKPSNNPCILTIINNFISACSSNSNLYYIDVDFSISGTPSQGVVKIEIDKVEHFLYLPLTSPSTFRINNLLADGQKHMLKISLYKDDYMSDERALCSQSIEITAPNACFIPDLPPCENCIGGFIPDPGQKYAISLWVKEGGASPSDTAFDAPFVQIQYNSGVSSPSPFGASGRIIEGWQRIYQEFTIPALATSITVQLGSNSGTSYFDDIRIYPVNGSMKSYVYDPVSLKLTAVLDENNYATFYEYDQEGTLIRTKKETERGIVTISENRQSNQKK